VAEGCWLLLLVLLPAAFNPAGALAFEPLKASILRGLAVVIGLAWLTQRLIRPSNVDVGAHPVVRAGLALIAFAGLSTVLSIEPMLSFWGSFDRGMGWLSLVAGGVLLLSAADLFSHERRRERAISALVLGALAPCGYLLLQRAGFDPITWTTLGASGSSFGSPTFLGGFLVIAAPFAAYRVFKAAPQAGFSYAGWLALLLVMCAVTFLTTIRGPILGLASATVTMAAFARPRLGLSRREMAGAAGLLVAALLLAVTASGSSGLAGLQRFATIARAGDSSVERLTVWRDALAMPLADPVRSLIGFGPETQAAVLEQGQATVRLTQNQQWDRAHNLFLDAWLTGGLVGVAALVVLLACAVYSAWRARAHAGDLLPAAVLAALVGHLVEASFAFETVVSGALLWVVLGLAASLSPVRWRAGRRARRAARDKRPARAAAGLSVVAGVFVVPLLVTPALADGLYGGAKRATYDVGAEQEEMAAQLAPWVEELPRVAALDWQQVVNRRGDDPATRARIELDLRAAAARAPMEPLPELRLARLYSNRDELDEAEQACQRSLVLGPYRAAAWDICADISARRGQTDQAQARRARGESLRRPL
jgi:O-antigen ligase